MHRLLFHVIYAVFALVVGGLSDVFTHEFIDILRWTVVGSYFLFCVGDAYREALFSKTASSLPHRLFLNPVMGLCIAIPAVAVRALLAKKVIILGGYPLASFVLVLIVFHALGLLGTYFLGSINKHSRAQHGRIPIWFEIMILIAAGMLFRYSFIGSPILSNAEIADATTAITSASTYVKSDVGIGYLQNRAIYLIMDPQGFLDYSCTDDCAPHALTTWHMRLPLGMYAFILLIGMYAISIEFFKKNSIALATIGLTATSAYAIAVSRTMTISGSGLLDVMLLAVLYTFFSYIQDLEKRKIAALSVLLAVISLMHPSALLLAAIVIIMIPIVTEKSRLLSALSCTALFAFFTALPLWIKSFYGGNEIVASYFSRFTHFPWLDIDAYILQARVFGNHLGSIFVLIAGLILFSGLVSFFSGRRPTYFYHVVAIIAWLCVTFFFLPGNNTVPFFLLLGFTFYHLEKLEKPRGAAMIILVFLLSINALYAYNTFFGDHSFKSYRLYDSYHISPKS